MATIVYGGGGLAGDWADPNNWKGGKAPTAIDTVQVLGGTSMAINGTVDVNAIMIINGGTDTFTGSLTTAGLGNCQGLMVCVGSTVVFAPGSSYQDGGVLQIGVGGVGGLIVEGTGARATAIQSNTGTIGKLAAAVGTVTINDASWTTTADLVVGAEGTGTLNVQSGGRVTAGNDFCMAVASGAVGSVNLASGGVMTVHNTASIGGNSSAGAPGVATLTIDTGATFDVNAGANVAAAGTVVMAGGTLQAGDTLGTLSVQAGGQVTGFGTVTTRLAAWLSDNGSIEARGGTLQLNGNVNGKGAMLIDADSTIAITGKCLLSSSLTFNGADSTLALAGVTATSISGFTAGDQIELPGIDKAVWNGTAQTLQLSDAGKAVGVLHLSGSYAGDTFSVAHSGNLGVITLHGS